MTAQALANKIIEDASHAFDLSLGTIEQARPVSGGCIADAWQIQTDQGRYFLKTHSDQGQAMFLGEAAGLNALSTGIRTPQVLAFGTVDGQEYLLLEWLDLGNGSAAALGEALAQLHAQPQPYFGFEQDNFIGAMPQHNGAQDCWTTFYRQKRLEPQLRWARQRGLSHKAVDAIETLGSQLDAFFSDYQPTPALIHGDMWGANHGFLADGTPVLFDPATYYGDREAEIAMTELFGGFAPDFYTAYQAHSPLDSGYQTRKTLYNLYHVLNHFNLFGGGYGQQAASMAQRLNAACKG